MFSVARLCFDDWSQSRQKQRPRTQSRLVQPRAESRPRWPCWRQLAGCHNGPTVTVTPGPPFSPLGHIHPSALWHVILGGLEGKQHNPSTSRPTRHTPRPDWLVGHFSAAGSAVQTPNSALLTPHRTSFSGLSYSPIPRYPMVIDTGVCCAAMKDGPLSTANASCPRRWARNGLALRRFGLRRIDSAPPGASRLFLVWKVGCRFPR